MDDIYSQKEIDFKSLELPLQIGRISEREKFTAAIQILLGLAVLYVITICAAVFAPQLAAQLLDFAKIAFPSLASIILVKYFHEQSSK